MILISKVDLLGPVEMGILEDLLAQAGEFSILSALEDPEAEASSFATSLLQIERLVSTARSLAERSDGFLVSSVFSSVARGILDPRDLPPVPQSIAVASGSSRFDVLAPVTRALGRFWK
ncbi:hypothetical protein UB45_11860 [Terrabacter sp. 28]|nr:hypothetical protein UB45_11860 [Terrabacter sp. 28]